MPMNLEQLWAFCDARLNEDAAAARRAGDSFRQIGETGVIVATDGERAEECASANWAGIAEHIVRHDPARVLAEVAFKRDLMVEHKPVLQAAEQGDEVTPMLVCLIDGDDCPFTRGLAAVYVDHDDYREK